MSEDPSAPESLDPRQVLVRRRGMSEPAPFDAHAAGAVLRAVAPQSAPARRITVTHRDPAPPEPAPEPARKDRQIAWPAMAAVLAVTIAGTTVLLQPWRPLSVHDATPSAPTRALPAYLPETVVEGADASPEPRAETKLATAARQPALRLRRLRPQFAPGAPSAYVTVAQEAAQPPRPEPRRPESSSTELALAAPPQPAQALVVVRQSAADVLSVSNRPQALGGGSADQRSVDPERMAAAVDVRVAVGGSSTP